MAGPKKKIVVLMGGVSLEHEVSLRSGQGVAHALSTSEYQPVPVTILKDASWVFPHKPPISLPEAVVYLRGLNSACVFIALHGPNGEDGRIQGLLDLLEIPYTGSGCAASAIAIDKIRAKAVAVACGARVARHFTVDRETWRHQHTPVIHRAQRELGFPVVLKAPCQGSSCGMAISRGESDFVRDMNEVMPLEGTVMVEQFIDGTEVTCAVLDDYPRATPRALPVTEIRPVKSMFFDYYSKYTPGATQEITPAPIGDNLTRRLQETAVKVHQGIGCSGWSRSDFIIDATGPVWLEVNTVPGLTETSLFPQAASAAGISYADLVRTLIELAISRHKRQPMEA